MRWATIAVLASTCVLGHAAPGFAQDDQARPASTTFWGDTGLWFVPTAEVLPTRDFAFSVQRTEQDFRQGNTNVSFWPVTAAFGVGRLEVFGSLRTTTRIDRDTKPQFFTGATDEIGGLVNEYPTVRNKWSGNHFGDTYLGAKLNLASQQRGGGMALAVRATGKIPTASFDDGIGTGEYDGFVDLIGSREFKAMEVAGFSGFALRGDPHDIDISDGVRWGIGAGFPSRKPLRITTELTGEWLYDHAVKAPAGLIVGNDGSLSPAESRTKDSMTSTVGLTWMHKSGFALGGAITYTTGMGINDPVAQSVAKDGDGLGVQFRMGWSHHGVKSLLPTPPRLVTEAPPAPTPAPEPVRAPEPTPVAAAPAPNRPPTVRVRCDPCSLRPGQSATLRAESTDPDGDPLTYLWSATGGSLGDTRAPTTQWKAETSPGLITFMVAVNDGRGGTASERVTIEVTAAENLAFEDVHFDFDTYRLRRDALPLLDPVIAAMKDRPGMRLMIEGHTCNIGTAEYNLALGSKRAEAVRGYLVERGIDAKRLSTVSYGEDRPSHDNTLDSGRRLNRRAVLLLRTTDTETQ